MPPTARYLRPQVLEDLRTRMAFVAGPRQVGKTTLARSLPGGGYLNWDVPAHRERILRAEMPDTRLWILDEIHRYRGWRNLLKGLWDGRRKGQRILVTGSARLDLYRFGGDSLQGRYHLLRLHPFSAAELKMESPADLRSLLALGGFPEPFLGGSEARARRWSRAHRNLLLREDVRDLERVDDLGRLELLALSLPARVGSPLSLHALGEELQVGRRVLERWTGILERLYAIFRVPPFGPPRLRAVRKMPKHYHLDWTLVPGEGPRFENLVACHLLKWVHFEEDAKGRDLELRHFRDDAGREVDFVVLEGGKPVLLVECKRSAGEVDGGLRYLHARFPGAEAWQIHLEGEREFVTPGGIHAAPALRLLSRLV
ncbi:MAG: AAA family ATPase [Planctomycetes bacterium]|nr:AAA family ATPase [Planctomycetota bacterium]